MDYVNSEQDIMQHTINQLNLEIKRLSSLPEDSYTKLALEHYKKRVILLTLKLNK